MDSTKWIEEHTGQACDDPKKLEAFVKIRISAQSALLSFLRNFNDAMMFRIFILMILLYFLEHLIIKTMVFFLGHASIKMISPGIFINIKLCRFEFNLNNIIHLLPHLTFLIQ